MENNRKKIASFSIDVPYKGAGNVIRQNMVPFDVFKDENVYTAVPLLNVDERRVANLPEQLVFTIENGKPKSPRKIDGNFHVIEDIVRRME